MLRVLPQPGDSRKGCVKLVVAIVVVAIVIVVVFLAITLSTPKKDNVEISDLQADLLATTPNPNDTETTRAKLTTTMPTITTNATLNGTVNFTLELQDELSNYDTAGGFWLCELQDDNITCVCELTCYPGYMSSNGIAKLVLNESTSVPDSPPYCASCVMLVSSLTGGPLYFISGERKLAKISGTEGSNLAAAYSLSILGIFWIALDDNATSLYRATLHVVEDSGDITVVNQTTLINRTTASIPTLALDDSRQALFIILEGECISWLDYDGSSKVRLFNYTVGWLGMGLAVDPTHTKLYFTVIDSHFYSVLAINYTHQPIDGTPIPVQQISFMLTSAVGASSPPSGLFYDETDAAVFWVTKDDITIINGLTSTTTLLKLEQQEEITNNETVYNALVHYNGIFYFTASDSYGVWSVTPGSTSAMPVDGLDDEIAAASGLTLVPASARCLLPLVENGLWDCDKFTVPFMQCSLSCQFPYRLSGDSVRLTCLPRGGFLPNATQITACTL